METALHYNMMRDYDATLGRYVQSDLIGLDGGWNNIFCIFNMKAKSLAFLFAVLLFIAFGLGTMEGLRAGQPEGPVAGQSSQWLEERRETITSWYFSENAALDLMSEHLAARKTHQPPPWNDAETSSGRRDWHFAHKGHLPVMGNGLVLGYKAVTKWTGPKFHQGMSVEQFSVFIPGGKIADDVVINIMDGNGAIVFWSSWTPHGPACFGYATNGEIELKRFPAPSPIGEMEELIPPGDERRFETIQAKLNLQFARVVSQSRLISGSRCSNFEIAGYREFYWRPLEEILSNE